MKKKTRSKGSGRGYVTYFWNFGTPSVSRERFELETSNLACRFGDMGSNYESEKLGQWRSEGVNWPTFEILGPSISREWFELKTSNLACRLSTGDTNDKNETLGQRGSGRGHVTYFWNCGIPSLSRERFELETSNLACRLSTGGTNDKNEIK